MTTWLDVAFFFALTAFVLGWIILMCYPMYRECLVPILGRVYVSRPTNSNPFAMVGIHEYVMPRMVIREWVLCDYVNLDGSRYCRTVDPISMRIETFNSRYRLAKGTPYWTQTDGT